MAVVFVGGKWLYKIHPAEGNVMVDVSRCVTVNSRSSLIVIQL